MQLYNQKAVLIWALIQLAVFGKANALKENNSARIMSTVVDDPETSTNGLHFPAITRFPEFFKRDDSVDSSVSDTTATDLESTSSFTSNTYVDSVSQDASQSSSEVSNASSASSSAYFTTQVSSTIETQSTLITKTSGSTSFTSPNTEETSVDQQSTTSSENVSIVSDFIQNTKTLNSSSSRARAASNQIYNAGILGSILFVISLV